MNKTLYRDDMQKIIGGVCSGLAQYFDIDVTIVRLVFLLTLILKGGGVLIYIILWIALPKKPFQMREPVVDYTVPPTTRPQFDPHFTGGKPVKKRTSGSIIAGVILMLLGLFFILDDLNIIPDWDMEHLWPLILIVVGVVIIFNGSKKQPLEKDGWNNPGTIKDNPADDHSIKTNPPTL